MAIFESVVESMTALEGAFSALGPFAMGAFPPWSVSARAVVTTGFTKGKPINGMISMITA